jgi:D-alanyl-D-alanine carboxypeptidase, serine-type, PBP4 family
MLVLEGNKITTSFLFHLKLFDKRMNKYLASVFLASIFLSSCSVQKRAEKVAGKFLFSDSALSVAHVGVALYSTADKKFVYNHDGEKYFIPASNTKIFTCYAAMKYLGDSLVGLRYETNKDGSITIQGTGDPTFLHPDFKNQPVYDFLKDKKSVHIIPPYWRESPLGVGWNWDDYNEDYAAERSGFPIYGNVARFYLQGDTLAVTPAFLHSREYSAIPHVNENRLTNEFLSNKKFSVKRSADANYFYLSASGGTFKKAEVPFKTSIPPVPVHSMASTNPQSLSNSIPYALLEDTLHKRFEYTVCIDKCFENYRTVHSQPTDSLLKIMMHRSDNFYAEQTLLMVSNQLLGVMSDEKIIDTLLKTDYKDLPQKPNWVDGSGLSRYNLITPQDEVKVLEKMKNNFSWNRVIAIFSTGGTGTLRTRYKKYTGKIYAKTGSLSDVISLSGFITTRKNHSYIFSVMINHHLADETEVRDKIERFISALMEKF